MATSSHPDAFYRDSLAAVPSLSAMSLRTYMAHLRALQQMGGGSIDHIVISPKAVYALICAKTQQAMSRQSYIGTVLSLYRHIPALKAAHPDQHKAWRTFMTAESASAEVRYQNNEPTDRQRAAHVPWPDILRMRDALDKTSTAYLLLCMMSMVPPLRADLDRLAIFRKPPSPTALADSPNYLLIDEKGGGIRLVLHAFKSKNVNMPLYSHDLPPDLCSVISASLLASPRAYLFVQPRSGEPFSSSITYTTFANKLLKVALQNTGACHNMIRHAFVSALPERLRVGDRQAIAKLMAHSHEQNLKYRLFFDNNPGHDVLGIPVVTL